MNLFLISDFKKIRQYLDLISIGDFKTLQSRIDSQIEKEKDWSVSLNNKQTNLIIFYTFVSYRLVKIGYNDEQVKRFTNSKWEIIYKSSMTQLYLIEKNIPTYIKEFMLKHKKYNVSPLVEDIIRIIEKKIRSNITVCEVASLLGKTPNYINSVFKKEMSTTIKQFMLRRKIELSKVYLSEGKSIFETAMDYDFYDTAHFTKAFKKFTGKTPQEYKRIYYYN